MTKTEPELANKSRRVIRIQLFTSVVVAVPFFFYQGQWASLSAIAGGLIAVSTALLLKRGVARATEAAKSDPKSSMAILYIGAVQRFVAVIVLLVMALGVLQLDALAVLVGFSVAQISYVIAIRK